MKIQSQKQVIQGIVVTFGIQFRVQVSPCQVYRVADHVSESLSGEDLKVERILQPVSKQDVLYVEILVLCTKYAVDDSMIPTRKNKEPWKEVKLARIFRGSDCLNPNSKSSYLQDSQYVGHFGSSVDFCKKLGGVIDSYGDLKDRLIFINDGATWILVLCMKYEVREWIADNYPMAVSVLDDYHALEYLYEFAEKAFPNASSEKDKWCDGQKDLLLASKVQTVLENIGLENAKEEEKKKIITYYENNKERMKYGQYRNIGCGIIGSGAIESAHRTVIQKRMKQSGQRWSFKGATNMLRLRVFSMNRQWAKVIDFLKIPTLAKCA